MIFTDDQGWDDIGLHNPNVITPNLDKLIQRSTKFDNMYVEPQCSQSRASLLTGRSHVRTGTMLVHGGECRRDLLRVSVAVGRSAYIRV